MSEQHIPNSQLLAIIKHNGDFKKNYGTIIGAFLYLRTLRATAVRSWPTSFWTLLSVILVWLERHGASWLRVD